MSDFYIYCNLWDINGFINEYGLLTHILEIWSIWRYRNDITITHKIMEKVQKVENMLWGFKEPHNPVFTHFPTHKWTDIYWLKILNLRCCWLFLSQCCIAESVAQLFSTAALWTERWGETEAERERQIVDR